MTLISSIKVRTEPKVPSPALNHFAPTGKLFLMKLLYPNGKVMEERFFSTSGGAKNSVRQAMRYGQCRAEIHEVITLTTVKLKDKTNQQLDDEGWT